MAGSGELFKGSDKKWGFRVKASNGKVVATDGGPPGYDSKADAKGVLTKLLKGDYNGTIHEAATIACGTEITADTVLDADLHCTKGGPALIVTADNITLDLAGHTISGDPSASSSSPGIVLRNVSGCTIQKGTVQHFGAGVAIMGGSGNVVQNMTCQDNTGSVDGDFGDGITLQGSSKNRITGNTVRRNGPFSGISLVGACTDNEVSNNIVSDNNMLPGDVTNGRQDMGIRIEGPGAGNNRILGNTVTNSGADGIVVLATCANPASGSCAGTPGNDHNEISKNMSHRNGTSGQGSGIRIFAVAQPVAGTHTTISDNVTNNNKTFGVAIDAAGAATPQPTQNVAKGNKGRSNGEFDGFDGNSACGTNTWENNDFGTVNQPCVSAPQHALAVAAPE